MRNLLNPKWLFIINTLPIVLLFFLFYGQFAIIQTLLEHDTILVWKSFGLSLLLLGLLNIAYTLYLIIKKEDVSIIYSFFALICYIAFIYVYAFYAHKFIPFTVPQWMVSENIFLYVGTFLMPTIAYAVLVLVSHFTSEDKEHKAWKNFLIAIGIPVTGYFFSQIILPLWQRVESKFFMHIFAVLLIGATLVFLFFLVRSVYILATKKASVWQKYQLVWKIPIAVILPLLGLAVNNGYLFNVASHGSGIFGDFNNPWFYILAVVNGILVCLPNLNNRMYRLLLFIGRSVTFTYTFYFFLVFLPFLPVSIVAVVAIGIGFLMLTPLLLFVIHTTELSKDVAYLKIFISQKNIIAISIVCFFVLPACVTIKYVKDKNTLNETLSYIYSPDYSKQYNIDTLSLQKTLTVVKSHKENSRSGGGIFGSGIPYLSSYFNWLVLDNLTLSDAKINTIEKIFFNKTSFKLRPENIQKDNVVISTISSTSTYDKTQNAWKSWVDLEITNKSGNVRPSEYATTIDLPDGCWISDYYLFVGDKKEPGILAEKKSAMWVFSQIRNENRDPGILYYLTGNKVAFRVFPFSTNEVRKTGIEFLHKESVKLTIDNNTIELGRQEETVNEKIETENIAYVSAKQKQALKTVKRTPYYHFLVDVSKNKNTHSEDFIKTIDQYLENNTLFSENAKISFVNTYVTTFPLDADWKQKYRSHTFEGGFYLDRAIRTTLFNAYQNTSYPIMIVVTDSIQHAILDKDFSDLAFAFPEGNIFFSLDNNGFSHAHSLTENPISELHDTTHYSFHEPVLEYKLADNSVVYLPNNNKPGIILKKDVFTVSETDIKEKNWQSALAMQGAWTSQILHPETSDKEWVNLVKYSFKLKVMSPVTSYLVVENEAQKAMLRKKQEQALSGNKSLDLGEDTQRMSEPGFIVLAIVFGLFVWYRKKRKGQLAE